MIVDLCCGTGALGLAVAAGLAGPGGLAGRGLAAGGRVELHAADLDPAAVACARRNVEPPGGMVYRETCSPCCPDRCAAGSTC